MKNKVKLIAHAANSLEKIKNAFEQGADLAEVDVAKQVFTNKFVAQHQGVLGKFGIGNNLNTILERIPQEKIIFDIKHPQFTPTIAEKFVKLLQKFNFNSALVTSDNWWTLTKIAEVGSYKIYFLVENEKNLEKLLERNSKNKLKFGAIVNAKFLNYLKVSELEPNELRVFAGPINDVNLCQKALELGVKGIITDEVKKLAKLLKKP